MTITKEVLCIRGTKELKRNLILNEEHLFHLDDKSTDELKELQKERLEAYNTFKEQFDKVWNESTSLIRDKIREKEPFFENKEKEHHTSNETFNIIVDNILNEIKQDNTLDVICYMTELCKEYSIEIEELTKYIMNNNKFKNILSEHLIFNNVNPLNITSNQNKININSIY